ncbi:MAG: CDP-alcohol phosphatidyltransferase family protein [bacterium]|nr:CDP-alcohol phosphatidyltransferase family protein [bacterium]
MFIGKYNKSLIITYVGVAFAIIGMNYALIESNLKIAMICMVIAGICDLFDGKVARMCKRTEEEKLFGIQIDSLSDMVGFVVFPVLIGYSLGLHNWYNIFGYILMVLAGITRLGFFNITVCETNKDEPVKTYSGLPVTSTSAIFPLVWFLCEVINGLNFNTIFPYITYIVAFLFVFNFKIPKFKGKAYIVISIIAIIGLLLMYFI